MVVGSSPIIPANILGYSSKEEQVAVNHQIGYRNSITQQISSLKIKIYNTTQKELGSVEKF